MPPLTGSLSIRHGSTFYSAYFERNGWIAAELVQYLDDLYMSKPVEAGLLKLLGYTLQISGEPPPRKADHWIELDLEEKLLATNSELIRKAVTNQTPKKGEPYWEPALRRIYSVLDQRDFTVRLF